MPRKRHITEEEQFIRELKEKPLSTQEKKTLKGQALNGDIEGARKGMAKLLRERGRWSYEHTCKQCGKKFWSEIKNVKYCSEKCKHEAQVATQISRQEHRKAVSRARKGMKGITIGILDERLAEAKSRGLSYAELQKEKTLELSRQGKI